MNIFVLSTGRCGSVTFNEACGHIDNFSSAHESQARILGDDHFSYPKNHIEIDNRLSWFLGRIDKKYGTEAYYVHLQRDETKTAASYAKRFGSGIIRGYAKGMMMGKHPKSEAMEVCLDYCKTVNSNIELFLKDKPHKMTIHLETAKVQFVDFWDWIGAEGNIEQALAEWDTDHNRTHERFENVKKLFKTP
ncbi:MAG: hypothetical protein ACI8ZB_000675 [Desulforhopalus sp.]|jgi:hypothetical protein